MQRTILIWGLCGAIVGYSSYLNNIYIDEIQETRDTVSSTDRPTKSQLRPREQSSKKCGSRLRAWSVQPTYEHNCMYYSTQAAVLLPPYQQASDCRTN
jgi:hypothetical protein